MQSYSKNRNLILASASPRRRELLGTLGLDFSIVVPDVDETPKVDESPMVFAERLATEKTAAVSSEPNSIIVGADTIVVFEGAILGKPVDPEHAFEMLAKLSGNRHEVITAVCIRCDERTQVFSVSTEVVFRAVTDQEIESYIATGCPMDKAGAYAIQGGAAHMVRAIHGSYTNVVGLPLSELHEALVSF